MIFLNVRTISGKEEENKQIFIFNEWQEDILIFCSWNSPPAENYLQCYGLNHQIWALGSLKVHNCLFAKFSDNEPAPCNQFPY